MTVASLVTVERVVEQVEEAFKREPGIGARHIRVKVAGHLSYRDSPDLKAGASALTCGSGCRADRPFVAITTGCHPSSSLIVLGAGRGGYQPTAGTTCRR